jgi:hypothetical protein
MLSLLLTSVLLVDLTRHAAGADERGGFGAMRAALATPRLR